VPATLRSLANALSRMSQGNLDAAVLPALNRAMLFSKGLAAREMQGRGNGNDELGRPRRKPGAARIWQTIEVIPPRRIGQAYVTGLKAGSPNVKHARIQELGGTTRPHLITVKRARFLVFYWKKVGAKVAFVRVNHPGSKIPAKPYLRPAIEKGQPIAQQEIPRSVGQWIEAEIVSGR
jgi:hypothetical protein